ncbi:hypothetical protein PS850_05161 [Pseudomonas fluorescens]|nr:hypothetical protein PS850_05161 [Pseudomonas fluorescens]
MTSPVCDANSCFEMYVTNVKLYFSWETYESIRIPAHQFGLLHSSERAACLQPIAGAVVRLGYQ